jgi:hypothetical protein
MKQKTFKLPINKKITVDNLLEQDDINSLLKDVTKEKGNLSGLIVIMTYRDGWTKWKDTGYDCDEMVGILEKVKVLEILGSQAQANAE